MTYKRPILGTARRPNPAEALCARRYQPPLTRGKNNDQRKNFMTGQHVANASTVSMELPALVERAPTGTLCLVGFGLACLGMFGGATTANAQVDRAAAVCVAFEEEIVPVTGPLGNTVLEHHSELVWHIGPKPPDLNSRERLEDTLISRLDGQVYVIDGNSCVWSDPGLDQTHLVVIAFEGVVREDLSVDPEDPRFQAFAIGYGSSSEEAEAEAVGKARFSGFIVGSGYEIVVRETWESDQSVARSKQGQADWIEPTMELTEPAPQPEASGMEPGTTFQDCSACPEMVVVPPGSFMMGSPPGWDDAEEPRHRVTIGAPFAVGVYEVTFAEWDACLRANWCAGYRPDDEGWGRGSRPVINVSWEDAQEYVRWLSRETGEAYRLLTEAEWEYAARAGTQTARYWGESESGQCRYGNGYDATGEAKNDRGWVVAACSDGYAETAPVGSFEPNVFGLYDALGNVSEWTADCWNYDGYLGAPADGTAWGAGDCYRRVLRGGSWLGIPWDLRLAYRNRSLAGGRYDSFGFRVARTMN